MLLRSGVRVCSADDTSSTWMLTTSLRCRSLSGSNIRCNNCYQSIVVPKCGTRYYCMSKQCVDFCEQCFTDAGVLHEHDRFLRIDGETGKHGPVTREVGVGAFSLDMLTHGTFSPGDAAYVPAWQRRSTQRNTHSGTASWAARFVRRLSTRATSSSRCRRAEVRRSRRERARTCSLTQTCLRWCAIVCRARLPCGVLRALHPMVQQLPRVCVALDQEPPPRPRLAQHSLVASRYPLYNLNQYHQSSPCQRAA